MTTAVFGFTSKAYSWGVNSPVPAALPTRMIVIASYGAAPGERVVIKVTNGAVDGSSHLTYLTVLDHDGDNPSPTIDLRNTEITLGTNAPASISAFKTIIKAEITADVNALLDGLSYTEPVRLYLYRNNVTNRNEVYVGNPPSGTQASVTKTTRLIGVQTRSDVISAATGQFSPLSGVQAVFYAKNTSLVLKSAVSDRNGIVSTNVPPGSYDVKFFGRNFLSQDWLTGDRSLSLGTSDITGRFGSRLDDTLAKTDFSVIKDRFASLTWVQYIIPEDFTSARQVFRDESADPNSTYPANEQLLYNFGRIFVGNSYVEYIGVGLDPDPT